MSKYANALERQLRTGFRRLRFAPNLEWLFREDYAERILAQRLILLLAGAVLVTLMPVVDAWLLHPPDAYLEWARRIQFGAILPALLIAFAFTADQRLRRWADPVGLLALLVVIGGWSAQRHLGAQFDYDVPEAMIGVVVAGTFAIAGMAFWSLAPIAALGMAVYALVELYTFGSSSGTWTTIAAQFALALVTALGGYLQEYHARAGWLQRTLLKELSERDSLTDLLNPRAFQRSIQRLYRIAERQDKPLLIAAVDVDFFKAYNDRYGHPAGDECLRQVAAVLGSSSRRAADLVARTGGEEFTVVWFDLPMDAAESRLDQLRAAVEALALPHMARRDWLSAVTISVGAVWSIPGPDNTPDDLLKQADKWLYESKRDGRNRVTVQMPQGVSRPAAFAASADMPPAALASAAG